MKWMIAGSREITQFDLSLYIPPEAKTIMTGGAKGVDALAEKYADEHGLTKIIFRPQYERYGRAAPLKRNEEMVDLADHILLIWNGRSKGTQYVLQYAKKKQKEVTLVCVPEKE